MRKFDVAYKRSPAFVSPLPWRVDHSVFCRRLLQGPRRQGVPVDALLAAAGIDTTADGMPERVSPPQLMRLLVAVIHELGDESFGLGQRPIKPGTFPLVLEMALHCETLGAAVEQSVRLYGAITDELRFDWELQDGEAALRISTKHPEMDPDMVLPDYGLLLWHRMLSWLAGTRLPVKRVEVVHDEPPSPERLAFFVKGDWAGGKSRFALVFSERHLCLPVLRRRRELQEHLEQVRSGVPIWPREEQGFSGRVRRIMAQALWSQQPVPALAEISLQLALTPQTLRRHLRDEGTGYTALSNALRRDVAIDKLHVQGRSVEEVAAELGFAEPRSFSRAFRLWTGRSPSAYLARRRAR